MTLRCDDSDKVQHRNLWEVVLDRIRDSIIQGEFDPGDRLIENDLADRFGVSRGPVREALRELARQGLVVDMPRRGTIVSVLTFSDLVEVYDVREALEQLAVGVAIKTATAADVRRLRDRYRAMERAWHSTSAEWAVRIATDLAFHQEIFRIAGNKRAAEMFEQLSAQTALQLRAALDVNPSLRLSPPDEVHSAIEQALLQRDAEAARDAVARHYEHTRERLFARLGDPDEPRTSDPDANAAPAKLHPNRP